MRKKEKKHMAKYFPEIENIYFKKTQTYFQEVVSSYANGNYRSAIVMLYSVVVCDMLFKLQELKDMFNDSVASEILKEVNKSRNEHNTKSKSQWEKELIDSIYEKTELLDLESYTHMNHLYDYRNFSAHPALNENYELIAPSKETTVACIKNVLNDILIKPPIFITSIIDTLTEDLNGKYEIYKNEYDKLTTYLNNKYFSKMSITMKKAVIKAFWKFCFCIPDNEDCRKNLGINRKALEILISGVSRETIDYIKENNNLFSVASDDDCISNLIIFLAKIPAIYNELNEDTILQIDNMINKFSEAKALSWFKYTTPKEHFSYLRSINALDLDPIAIKQLAKHYENIGETYHLINFLIWYYGESRNFNMADERFEVAIEPYLEKMEESHFKQLIECTNSNRQIWARGLSSTANNKIMQYARKYLDEDFEYEKYPNFKFDYEISDTTIKEEPQQQEAIFSGELPF